MEEEITLKYTGVYRLEYPMLHLLYKIDTGLRLPNESLTWFAIKLRDNLTEAEIASLLEKMELLKS